MTMKKIGVFYGSSTGTTEGVAETIGQKLGVAAADIHDVRIRFEHSRKERDVPVCHYSYLPFHNNL